MKKGHRYPFISNELLNCDVGKINDYFLNSEADIKKEENENSEEITKVESDNKVENEEVEETEKTEEAHPEEQEAPKEESKVEEVEEVKHEEPSHNIELLDLLLNFIDTDAELNYVLAGYFSKFLNNLINKYPHRVKYSNSRLLHISIITKLILLKGLFNILI